MSTPSIPSAPSTYQYGNLGNMDVAAVNNINGLANNANQGLNTYNSYFPAFSGQNNPTGYDPAQTVQYGNGLSQFGTGLQGMGQQLYNAGFDPQNQLYNRTLGQVTDQGRVAQAARGIDMTPYGAQIEGQNLNNFNIDWQNNQLGRETSAANAALPYFSQGSKDIVAGQGLAQSGPQFQLQQLQGLGQAQSATLAPQQQAIQDYLAYLQGGTQANQAATQNYNAQLSAQQQGASQSQATLGGLGNLAGMALSFT